MDFKVRNVKIDGRPVRLQIWDTAGQDRFKTITSAYYRGSHGIIVVYSIISCDTFTNVRTWLEQIDLFAGASIHKLIIGNKCDLESQRQVEFATAKEFADSHGIPIIETSAKDATNVDEAFMRMAHNIYETQTAVPEEPKDVVDTTAKSQKKGGC